MIPSMSASSGKPDFSLSAISSKLRAHISGWDTDMGDLKDWYREA